MQFCLDTPSLSALLVTAFSNFVPLFLLYIDAIKLYHFHEKLISLREQSSRGVRNGKKADRMKSLLPEYVLQDERGGARDTTV